jgi:YidC/Oxa1 family membrane protein insertase
VERRVILAILLMLIVAVLPSIIWPRRQSDGRTGAQPDSLLRPSDKAPSTQAAPLRPPERPSVRASDTVLVTTPLARLGFSTLGGRLLFAQFPAYRSFAPADSHQSVQVIPPGRPMLEHRLIVGTDTIRLSDWSFGASDSALDATAGGTLQLRAPTRTGEVRLEYRFRPDDYRFDVSGVVEGLTAGATLLIDLAEGLRSVEADSGDDFRRFAVVRRRERTEISTLGSFKRGERRVFEGPFQWVGVKSKYFLVAALAVEEGQPRFSHAVVAGLGHAKNAAPRAEVTLALPVAPTGQFSYSVFAGPMEHKRLSAVGHGFDDANPYGWSFLRPIIHPVSVVVVDILLWMHERLNIAYGWVLVIFGFLVRLLLWPLNQKAMESSLRLQAVAPMIKEVQDRYRKDPEKLQREMLRIYREHRVNPFGGCLPMLLPMPVLFALFFVFDNTIAFRGVPFLWLPDLSRADPFYIIPILMGASMYALMRVGQIGVPPNPQTKMMTYFMPVMMVVLFFGLASGLNLYYTVQNVLSLPQQYWVAMKRLKQQGKTA